jgi:hypothetical protein
MEIVTGWRKFFTFTYWRLQFKFWFLLGRPLNIISVTKIEIPEGEI